MDHPERRAYRRKHPNPNDYEVDCAIELARRRGCRLLDVDWIGPGPWDAHGKEISKFTYERQSKFVKKQMKIPEVS